MHPKYTKKMLEEIAQHHLYKSGNIFNLLAPAPLDVERFAEYYLGLNFDYAKLSMDGSTLGCICFNDGLLEVYKEDGNSGYIKTKKGTIIIDSQAEKNSIPARTNFTIMHECAHWILHREYYQKVSKFDFEKFVYVSDKTRIKMTSDEIKEWQANYLAAALLMPKDVVIEKLKWLLGVKNLDKLIVSQPIISEMAKSFNVSKQAMNIRLKNLNII